MRLLERRGARLVVLLLVAVVLAALVAANWVSPGDAGDANWV